LAAEAGADAAKFQNFRAAKIVSDHGSARWAAAIAPGHMEEVGG